MLYTRIITFIQSLIIEGYHLQMFSVIFICFFVYLNSELIHLLDKTTYIRIYIMYFWEVKSTYVDTNIIQNCIIVHICNTKAHLVCLKNVIYGKL